MPCFVTLTARHSKVLSSRENAHIMLKTAAKCSNYAENQGLCFSFWIMLFEADYAKNYASIMYQCLGTRYSWKKLSIAFLAQISWLAALATSPNVGRLRKISIAFLAPISWLAALATSPKLGRLQKISIAFLAPISWPAPLATSPKLGRLEKLSIAFLAPIMVTRATRSISKAWSTSKNFQSHFSRQYRD